MDFPPLNPIEVRVLGSLVEKQVATPDYYPLSLNALVAACNQLTNRDPVVAYDEATILRGLEGLRERRLSTVFQGGESRVAKYRQALTDAILLTPAEVAVLCVLMLRGPQTVGELRTRAERLYAFEGLTEVEEVLQGLASRTPAPLAVRLARQPGMKESRHAHLLGGPVEGTASSSSSTAAGIPGAGVGGDAAGSGGEGASEGSSWADRLARLEGTVGGLRGEIDELKRELAVFRKQFE